MVFEIRETDEFHHIFEELEPAEKAWVLKIVEQLKLNPYNGKPLGYRWFREKKWEGKRLYYLIYQNNEIILLASYGDKKDQKEIITFILENRERFRKLVEEN